jgi:hypothetical protein
MEKCSIIIKLIFLARFFAFFWQRSSQPALSTVGCQRVVGAEQSVLVKSTNETGHGSRLGE